MTNHGSPDSIATSYMAMEWGWVSFAAFLPSRNVRSRTSSAVSVSRPSVLVTCFTATSRLRRVSRASQTAPMPPSPILERSRYRPASRYSGPMPLPVCS